MRRAFLIMFVLLGIVTPGFVAYAQVPNESFTTATVLSIGNEIVEEFQGMTRTVQELLLRIDDGPEAGKEITLENGVLPGRDDTVFAPGERVVMGREQKANGQVTYVIREKYRIPALVWLTIAFVALGIVLGGRTGITSIAGLAASVAILILFVIPRIAAGSNPLLVSFLGCVAIACTSLYLAHGFQKRTSVALLSIIVTLVLAVAVDLVFVHAAQVFGMGSEESLYLQTGLLQNIDLRGLLLGGILIGALGVLDDITTAQTAAIDEISKANPRMNIAQLLRAGQSVGREHIASLINTLALAYVGAALPLLLLLKTQGDYPLWVTINNEFFAEEIVRTLVGSCTLLLAVPISTWFAAYFFQGGRGGHGTFGHHHA